MQVQVNGITIDFHTALELMDEDLREYLYDNCITTEQLFVNRYCKLHREIHGEPFIIFHHTSTGGQGAYA